jgi:chromosome partitioning protein
MLSTVDNKKLSLGGPSMKNIMFCSSKGGVGKTTLCFNLGIEAAKSATVYFCDVDPQKSLTGICKRRGKEPGLVQDNPMLLEDVRSIGSASATLKRIAMDRDYIFCDTPGSFVEVYTDAIAAADVIVVPLRYSPLDLLAQEDVLEVIDDLGKLDNTVFALNAIDSNVNVDDVMERIMRRFPNKPLKIKQRVDYARSLVAGKTGAEFNKKDCGPEIAGLWTAIKDIIRKFDDENIERGRHGNPASVQARE